MVQSVEATPKGFVPLRTHGDALSISRREKALQVLCAQCLFLFMSMLNTKWKRPSRRTRKASIVWCQVKEASSRALQKLEAAESKAQTCVCVRATEVSWGTASRGGNPEICVCEEDL